MASKGGHVPIERATVVICSRERPAMLIETIESVLGAATLPAEIVVVDQSTAANEEVATLGAVRGCEVRYLHSETTGLSRARNLGIKAAAEDVVVLLDDDMFVQADWLEHLVAGLPEDPRGVATGRVLAAPDEGRGGTVPGAALVQREQGVTYRGPQDFDVVPGANVALRRDVVLGLGGYDERLGAGSSFASADDNDIGQRLLEAGSEVRHVPAAVVYHRAWRTRGELLRLRWLYGRGKGAFYAKHARLRDRQILKRAFAEAARRLKRAAVMLVKAPRASARELISLGGMLTGALEWIVRERIPSRARQGPR
jgi:GT2 family glycosyltransferase